MTKRYLRIENPGINATMWTGKIDEFTDLAILRDRGWLRFEANSAGVERWFVSLPQWDVELELGDMICWDGKYSAKLTPAIDVLPPNHFRLTYREA